jgi:thioredoxin-dependent peroxiredoxin
MDTNLSQAPAGKGKVQVGDPAPDFTLPTQKTEQLFHLHDLIGKSAIVLYFYPKDDTPGCTSEACSFRDSYETFKQVGAEVIGISSDSEESHQQFASKYKLPFTLLSDKGGALRKKYGVPTTLGLLPGRVTYIIDKEGIVRHIFSSQMHIDKHVTEALEVVRSIAAQ